MKKQIIISLYEDAESGIGSIRVRCENLQPLEAVGMLSNALHQHMHHTNDKATKALYDYAFEKGVEPEETKQIQ